MLDATKVTTVETSGFEAMLKYIAYIHEYTIFLFGVKRSVAHTLKLHEITKANSSIYKTTLDKILNDAKRWYEENVKQN
jgi:anti-anti-sigma regulatory factor